jgi:hypothetical protein
MIGAGSGARNTPARKYVRAKPTTTSRKMSATIALKK